MMKSTLEMPEKGIDEVTFLLNTLMADEYVLYTKTRNAHWNTSGPNFYELHTFFEIQCDLLNVMIDVTAKRVRSLGRLTRGSLKDFLNVTDIGEVSPDFGSSSQVVQLLINDHETIIRMIRDEIIPISNKTKDFGTADLASGLMEQHEKMIWMLRSFLTTPDFSATNHIRTITDQLVEVKSTYFNGHEIHPIT
jgi:starvation-inducible DNA-binding protein